MDGFLLLVLKKVGAQMHNLRTHFRRPCFWSLILDVLMLLLCFQRQTVPLIETVRLTFKLPDFEIIRYIWYSYDQKFPNSTFNKDSTYNRDQRVYLLARADKFSAKWAQPINQNLGRPIVKLDPPQNKWISILPSKMLQCFHYWLHLFILYFFS